MIGRAISRTMSGAALVLALLTSGSLAACRPEAERSALAQVPGDVDVLAGGRVHDMPGVELRRVWADDYVDFYASSISPDGRYLSMIDWTTVDLAVRDLETGELHRLTNVRRGEGKPYEDAGVSVFSRDGERLAVGWQYFPLLQLRAFDFETDPDGTARAGASTVIFSNPEYEPYYPFDWSPEGGEILAKVYTSAGANQLALISMDGGYRALKSFDWREPTMAEFSPDGRYVAYDFPPEPDAMTRDVYVVSVDGSRETRLVEWPGMERLLGWHPDGSILFHSDRGGTPGVWRVSVDAGRAVGEPELVKADMWGVEPLGFAGDRFYYGLDVNPERLYTAGVDLESGRVTSAPVAVADPTEIGVRGWAWSPDGRFIAYVGSVPGVRGSRLVIRAVGGEEVESHQLELRRANRIHWHPDGTLIVYTSDLKGRRGFYRIDRETGTYSSILLDDEMERPTPRGSFALSPDGTTLYFARRTADIMSERLEVVALDLASRETRHVAVISGYGMGPIAISPDGARLAVIVPAEGSDSDAVATIPVTGGPATELATIPPGMFLARLEWSSDGWVLYRLTVSDSWSSGCVCAVDADGVRESHRLELGGGVRNILRVHPDGTRIAFMAGEPRGEVWVMDGLGARSAAAGGSDDSR